VVELVVLGEVSLAYKMYERKHNMERYGIELTLSFSNVFGSRKPRLASAFFDLVRCQRWRLVASWRSWSAFSVAFAIARARCHSVECWISSNPPRACSAASSGVAMEKKDVVRDIISGCIRLG
jgi:hypothetical protein